MPGRARLAAVLAVLAAGLAHAAPAGALQLKSCAAYSAAKGCAPGNLTIFGGAGGLAVSADGRYVYTGASGNSGAIATWARNAKTGALTLRSCVAGSGGDGCTSLNNTTVLDDLAALAISPDGKYVYSAASAGDAVGVFARDGSTGALTFKSCISKDAKGGCTDINNANALDGAEGLVVSPDGKYVYTTDGIGDSVSVMRRTDTGALTGEGCLGATSSGPCAVADASSLDAPSSPVMSADGKHIYVVAAGRAVTTIDRDPANGHIAFGSCLSDTGAGLCDASYHPSAFNQPVSLTLAPGDAHLYAGSVGGQTLTSFTRSATTGDLSFLDCLNAVGEDGCRDVGGNVFGGGIWDIEVTADGLRLYALAHYGVVTALGRNRTSGLLGFRGCLADSDVSPCERATPAGGFFSPYYLRASPDGRFLYTLGPYGLAVVGVRPPHCSAFRPATPASTAIRIRLRCLDPDGGDPLHWFAGKVAHGQLGAVDQAGGTVLYAPNQGFVGVDRLSFGATDYDGSGSAVATISVGRIFGKRSLVSLALAEKRISGGGPVPVRVKNGNGFAVRGTLRAKHGTTSFGGKSFTVPKRGERVVKLTLPEKLRDVLRRTGELGLDLAATVRAPEGKGRTVRKHVTAELK